MTAASSLQRTEREREAVPVAVAAGFRAAIEAALAHVGATAPNPPVGCAILDRAGNLLVAAGHERAGQPHAEALALRRLADMGRLDEADTLLVTLEPCNHRGRTGPCTEAILASPVRTVWIGCPDPNPHVHGGGAERLSAAGLAVHWLGDDPEQAGSFRDCQALIAPFRRFTNDGRPWITVKQAVDRSGGMVPPAGAKTFTDAASLLLAHRLRRCTDAIVTGSGTVLADHPHFTVRHLPDHAPVPSGRRRLLVVLGQPANLPDDYAAAATARGFDVRPVASLDRLLPTLAEAGVLWAMVEAGPRVLESLRAAGLWDDWLTVTSTGNGPDRLSITRATGRDISPLSLLPELGSIEQTQEDACSRAS